jgi:2-succinyl-5-enolpyruvyl-6-hydroxy-3-cyclohexene-1-carboxylate synthase
MTDVVALRGMVEELVRAGVSDVVVCPGSRSTPLALAARAHPGLRVRVLLDERSAGFFALGLARASRRPVGVIVTSGTAAANLLPAVVEASMAHVPLLLLTADRPPELQDRGAPQTIDQVRLFGSYVRWFAPMPLLDGAPETRRHVRSVMGRAVAAAEGDPAGPVHLNIQFREPLVPESALGPLGIDDVAPGEDPDAADERRARPFTEVVAGRPQLVAGDVTAIAARLGSVARGLIVAGPQDDPALPAALARLAEATGYPIVADPLSGVRCGPHDRGLVLAHADHLVRPGPWRDAHLPEIVIRFGATPTSKPVATLIAETSPAQIVVDGNGGWSDPAIIPTTFIHADATVVATALADAIGGARAGAGSAGRTDGSWGAAWTDADRRADSALVDWLARVEASGEPFEGLPFAVLGASLPDGALLWAGNSMPVRDLDAWLPAGPRSLRALSNRGANGIDGVVSTALGAAVADVGPVTLVVGDVSFLHDLNALVAARLHAISATIVLIENDGGGIFSFLPQATTDAPDVGLPGHYEELFGTPHGIDLGPVVTALGGHYESVGPAELREALTAPFAGPGVRVLGFRTDRARNVELHREAAAAVTAALSQP